MNSSKAVLQSLGQFQLLKEKLAKEMPLKEVLAQFMIRKVIVENLMKE
ncbi:hypothetical protein H8D30_00055 [bacterium]|nr:hypothetical protein [bacterium]